MSDDVCALSLVDVADAIAAKRVSSVEATDACLARIDRLQPRINAFITVDRDAALAAARRADARIARGEPIGPLHGVPLAHKDTYYRAGRIATCGTRFRRDFVPDRTATVLRRLDDAGAIDLGGVNTSDSGCNAFGLNILVGRAKNPWNADYTTGGSSSGSGCSVAARLVFGSFGSDSGGSIRLPAAMCGVAGLKPTDRRISRYGIMPLSFSLDSPGPIARTVADLARLTRVAAGRDDLDPSTSHEPVPDYEATLGANLRGRRIGVPRNYFADGVAPDIGRAVGASLDVFRGLGAEIIDLDVPDPTYMEALGNLVVFAEGARVHARWLRERPEDYTPVTRNALEFGLCVPATEYIDALVLRGKALADYLETVFSQVDVLHTATLRIPVPSMAEAGQELANEHRLPWNVAFNTKPFSFMGLPALSVPCGFSDSGLPVGFQLAGPPFSEALLFNLGHVFQRATDFHRRSPEP